jgi:site-specific recombinase XerD
MDIGGVENRKKRHTPTLSELISRYELSNVSDGKSPKTVTWYSEILHSFGKYLDARRQTQNLSSFTIENLRGYILYLRQKPKYEGHPYIAEQDKPVSPKTIQCHVRALKAFSSWLHDEGYTKTNILSNLKLPKAPAIIIEPLSSEEIRLILAIIDKDSATSVRNHAILETMLDTGLRESEIAGITLSGLNLKDGYIKVLGKGSKERIVPIGKHVQMTLLSYIDKIRPTPDKPDCKHLFLSRSSEPITPNTIKLVFSRLAKKSGVNRLHAHLCRHTFAINYLLNGGDIFSLKEILGHTTLDMVNHYLHFTTAQIVVQHHKYSPMDKLLINTGRKTQASDLVLAP